MPLADTNRTRLSYRLQAAFGESATGGKGLQELRITGEDFADIKETVESAELRSDGALVDLLQVGAMVKWSFDFELSYLHFDDFLAAAFRDVFNQTPAAVTATASTDLFARTAHGFLAGDAVVFSSLTGGAGITAGQRYYVISSGLTADAFKVSATAGGSTIDVTTNLTAGLVARTDLLRNGTTVPYFHFQRDFLDIGHSHYFTDCAVDTLELNVEAKQIVKGKVSGMGIFGGLSGLPVAVTGTASTDTFALTAHGFTAGTPVVFASLTGGAGITAGTIYYVIASGLTADAFKVSATSGGSTIDVTTDLTAGTVARSLPYTPTITARPTAPPIFTSGARVSGLLLDGAASSEAVRKISFKINGNLRERPVVTSLYSAQYGQGDWRVSISPEFYFQTPELHRKYIVHTAIGLGLTLGDSVTPSGTYALLFPRLQIANSKPVGDAKNKDVMQPLELAATYSSTIGAMGQILRTAGV